MKNTKIIILILITFFIAGCGGGGGDDTVVPLTPVLPSSYSIDGKITGTNGQGLSNYSFTYVQNTSYSFVTNLGGEYVLGLPDIYNFYISFISNDGNYKYSVFLNSAESSQTVPDVYFFQTTTSKVPFLIPNDFSYEKKANLLSVVSDIVSSDLDTAITKCDNYINLASVDDDYKKLLYILKDYAVIMKDFSNINSIDTALYVSTADFYANYYSPRTYYGGMLFVIKNLLYSRENFSLIEIFLEKINADDLNFFDNNMNIFKISSDDIKAMLLLDYVYQNKESDINKFKNFNVNESGTFAYMIYNLLENAGYFSRESY